MLNKAYIEQRAEHRLEIERQTSEFLSRGGKIDVRQPGESSVVEGPSNRETKERVSRAVEQDRRARAAWFGFVADEDYHEIVGSLSAPGHP